MIFDEEVPQTKPQLFNNANEFSLFIETRAVQEEMTCTSILLQYCDERDLDPEDIAKFINASLREKVAREMQEDGLLPKNSELSFED